jgi:hypothetical protein
MTFEVGEWTVKVVTGTQSQTVNARRSDAPHTPYDFVVRMRTPRFVSQAALVDRQFDDIEGLVRYLVQEYQGTVEQGLGAAARRPLRQRRAHSTASDRSADSDSAWLDRAVVMVEHAIDQLVLEFAAMPYLHRVEHSLHCELYTLLTANRFFGRCYPMAGCTAESQLVHKEWPEPRPRPEKAGRRGNLDLAVLHPDDLAQSSIDDFRFGRSLRWWRSRSASTMT